MEPDGEMGRVENRLSPVLDGYSLRCSIAVGWSKVVRRGWGTFNMKSFIQFRSIAVSLR